jgi:hypothetical protein
LVISNKSFLKNSASSKIIWLIPNLKRYYSNSWTLVGRDNENSNNKHGTMRLTIHVVVKAKVNQPPWLYQLAVLSIGWAGWLSFFHSPFYLMLTNIQPQSIFFGWWSLTIFFFHCQFFPNPAFHTTHQPTYPTDLNFNLAYKLTTNPLLTLARLLSSLG